MALSTEIQSGIRASALRTIGAIQEAAQAAIDRQVQAQIAGEQAAAARAIESKQWAATLERKHRSRMAVAMKGLQNLFALCEIPELYELGMRSLKVVLNSADQPEKSLLYYLAMDDHEWVAIGIHPGGVIVNVDGEYAQYREHIDFACTDTVEVLREKLSRIVSTVRYLPWEVQKVFDKPGDNGDLPAIAFQVLVDSASEKRLKAYLAPILPLT